MINVTATATLTVIPAEFKDPVRALLEMVDAKRSLDEVTEKLREREQANAEERAKGPRRLHDGVDLGVSAPAGARSAPCC